MLVVIVVVLVLLMIDNNVCCRLHCRRISIFGEVFGDCVSGRHMEVDRKNLFVAVYSLYFSFFCIEACQ